MFASHASSINRGSHLPCYTLNLRETLHNIRKHYITCGSSQHTADNVIEQSLVDFPFSFDGVPNDFEADEVLETVRAEYSQSNEDLDGLCRTGKK